MSRQFRQGDHPRGDVRKKNKGPNTYVSRYTDDFYPVGFEWDRLSEPFPLPADFLEQVKWDPINNCWRVDKVPSGMLDVIVADLGSDLVYVRVEQSFLAPSNKKDKFEFKQHVYDITQYWKGDNSKRQMVVVYQRPGSDDDCFEVIYTVHFPTGKKENQYIAEVRVKAESIAYSRDLKKLARRVSDNFYSWIKYGNRAEQSDTLFLNGLDPVFETFDSCPIGLFYRT